MQSGVGRDQSVQVEHGAVFPQESTETDEVGTVGYRAADDLQPFVDPRRVATLIGPYHPKTGELSDARPENRVERRIVGQVGETDYLTGCIDGEGTREGSSE